MKISIKQLKQVIKEQVEEEIRKRSRPNAGYDVSDSGSDNTEVSVNTKSKRDMTESDIEKLSTRFDFDVQASERGEYIILTRILSVAEKIGRIFNITLEANESGEYMIYTGVFDTENFTRKQRRGPETY